MARSDRLESDRRHGDRRRDRDSVMYNDLERLSKKLVQILRHRGGKRGLRMRPDGFMLLSEVVVHLRRKLPDATEVCVEEAIQRDHRRFEATSSPDGRLIRALFGHSTDVEPALVGQQAAPYLERPVPAVGIAYGAPGPPAAASTTGLGVQLDDDDPCVNRDRELFAPESSSSSNSEEESSESLHVELRTLRQQNEQLKEEKQSLLAEVQALREENSALRALQPKASSFPPCAASSVDARPPRSSRSVRSNASTSSSGLGSWQPARVRVSEEPAGPEPREQNTGTAPAVRKFCVAGCNHADFADGAHGEYLQAGPESHGRPVFRRRDQDRSREMVLYFYKDVNFSEFTGWYIAPSVMAEETWAFCPGDVASPPEEGWMAPYNEERLLNPDFRVKEELWTGEQAEDPLPRDPWADGHDPWSQQFGRR